jgi:hypothetical protein
VLEDNLKPVIEYRFWCFVAVFLVLDILYENSEDILDMCKFVSVIEISVYV